jgi:hypothetical protein
VLGEAQALGALGRLLGLLAVAAAVVLFARLQAAGVALRRREQASRWASNLRDVLNLFAVAALLLAFRACGGPWAACFLFAGSVGVALEVARLQPGSPRQRSRRALLLGLGLALPLGAFMARALEGANRLADLLFR